MALLSRVLNINRNLRNFSTFRVHQLVNLGINNSNIKYNLSYEQLFKDEVKNKEGQVFKTEYGDTFGETGIEELVLERLEMM